MYSVSEFHEFRPHLKSLIQPVLFDRRLKSGKNQYKFKWNQSYLSRDLNLNRGSNSLDSASENITEINDYYLSPIKLFHWSEVRTFARVYLMRENCWQKQEGK